MVAKGIQGKLHNEYFLEDYIGIKTNTAETIVNNRERTIAVNVNLDEINKTFVYKQETASNTWYVHHNLKKIPNVFITNDNGEQIIGNILYPDVNNITIIFSQAVSGSAYLN